MSKNGIHTSFEALSFSRDIGFPTDLPSERRYANYMDYHSGLLAESFGGPHPSESFLRLKSGMTRMEDFFSLDRLPMLIQETSLNPESARWLALYYLRLHEIQWATEPYSSVNIIKTSVWNLIPEVFVARSVMAGYRKLRNYFHPAPPSPSFSSLAFTNYTTRRLLSHCKRDLSPEMDHVFCAVEQIRRESTSLLSIGDGDDAFPHLTERYPRTIASICVLHQELDEMPSEPILNILEQISVCGGVQLAVRNLWDDFLFELRDPMQHENVDGEYDYESSRVKNAANVPDLATIIIVLLDRVEKCMHNIGTTQDFATKKRDLLRMQMLS